jgi:hypothetical protein
MWKIEWPARIPLSSSSEVREMSHRRRIHSCNSAHWSGHKFTNIVGLVARLPAAADRCILATSVGHANHPLHASQRDRQIGLNYFYSSWTNL